MVMDINWTYCGDHFAIHTSKKPLQGTLEANMLLCQLYPN